MNLEPILVRAPNWLGDIVMASSALESLHRTGRYALHLLIRPPWGDLFRSDPRVAEVMEHGDRGADFVSTASVIRRKGFDVVVDFTHSLRSLMLWKLAGIRQILREPAPRREASHQVMRYLSVVRPLISGAPEVPYPPALFASPAPEKSEIRNPTSEILIFPCAAYGPAKMWSTDRYVDMLSGIADRGWPIRLLGTESDRRFLNELSNQSKIKNQKSKISMSAGLPLADLLRLIAGSSVVISCDSGAAHLAAALGKPTLALFFSTDPFRTAPLGPAVHVVCAAVPCRPCFLRTCPIGYLCRDAITPALVLAHLDNILDVPATPRVL